MSGRVLHIAAMPFPTRQGTQASILAMLRAHVDSGDETHLLTYAHGDGRALDPSLVVHRASDVSRDRSERSGPSLRKLVSDASLARRLGPLVATLEPTAIFAHHVEAAAACVVAGIDDWTFVAHTSLGEELPVYLPPRGSTGVAYVGRRFERMLVERASRVFAVAPRLAAHLTSVHGRVVDVLPIPWQAMRVVPGDRHRARGRLGLDDAARVAIYAGNLDAYQGLERVYEAIVDPRLQNVCFVIATADVRPLPPHIASRVVRVALSSADDWIAAADVGLAPRATLGGVAVKVFEYLSRGLFVVAAPLACGGQDFGDRVLLVDEGDEAWSNAIQRAFIAPPSDRSIALDVGASRAYLDVASTPPSRDPRRSSDRKISAFHR